MLARLFGHLLFLEICISIQHNIVTVCVAPSVSQQKLVLNGLKISAESMMFKSSYISLKVQIM